MKKFVFLMLLLCIFHSIKLYTMDKNTERYSCSTFFSFFRSCISSLVPIESQYIQDLRRNKNDFEEALQLENLLPAGSSTMAVGFWPIGSKFTEGIDYDTFNNFLRPFSVKMNDSPIKFLRYCHYQKFHEDKEEEEMQELVSCSDLLTKCKAARINGYSALGAVIITRDVSIDNKRNVINRLMNYGFELTEKDRALAELELYDGTPAEQKAKMIWLLCDFEEGNLSMLPHDVRKYIVYSMLGLFKAVSWPCPTACPSKF